MSTKGESKGQKRISVGPERMIKRKAATWTVRSRAGKHSKATSLPLGFVARDIFGLAATKKEAKEIIHAGSIKINGKAEKNYNANVGLFDVLDIELMKKRYRCVFDKKGRLVFREIGGKGKIEKPSKITSKRVVKKGNIMITTNDGYNFTAKSFKVGVGDSLKIELPSKKIAEEMKAEKGSMVFLVSGTHVGMTAKIVDIAPATMLKPKLLKLESGKEKFMTVAKNVFVIGKGKDIAYLGLDEKETIGDDEDE